MYGDPQYITLFVCIESSLCPSSYHFVVVRHTDFFSIHICSSEYKNLPLSWYIRKTVVAESKASDQR